MNFTSAASSSANASNGRGSQGMPSTFRIQPTTGFTALGGGQESGVASTVQATAAGLTVGSTASSIAASSLGQETGNPVHLQGTGPPPSFFRDQFSSSIRRQDRQPVTCLTKVEDLEENGQQAIQLLLDEVEFYQELKTRFSEDRWLQKDSVTADLEKEFDDRVREMEQTIELQEAIVDEVEKAVTSEETLLNELKDAIFNAGQLEEELKELQAELRAITPARKRELERDQTVYKSRVRLVGPFVFDTIKKLNTRCGELMEQIDNFEEILLNQDEPEQAPEFEDFVKLVKTVDKLSVQIEKQTEQIQKEMDQKKRAFLDDLRKEGNMSDPFAEADEEDRRKRARSLAYIPMPAPIVRQEIPFYGGLTVPRPAPSPWQLATAIAPTNPVLQTKP